jgi:protein-tyrosine phosphatase
MDDGSKTLEQSIEMLQMAAAAGTTDLVCTPHANTQYKFEPPVIAERIAELRAGIGDLVRLYTGCDFHLSYDNIQDAIAHPAKYTINQNRYLLVEFSDLLIFRNTGEIFGHLQDAGMTPIITHPERNELLQQRIDEIAQWVEAGALVQVTGQSLTGRFGRRAAEFANVLLERRLVHFIASDGHGLKHRPPTMDEAHAWLVKNHGQALADALCTSNPAAVLTGESVSLPDVEDALPARKWYQVWR